MPSKAVRSRHFTINTNTLEKFCRRYNMSVNPLNNGYQMRVENMVDFYPVNGRYCILQTGERGDWRSPQDLRNIMLKALPHPRHLDMYDRPKDSPYGEPVTVEIDVPVIIARNRLARWVLRRRFPGRPIVLRRELKAKQRVNDELRKVVNDGK